MVEMNWLTATWLIVASAVAALGVARGVAMATLRDAHANAAFMLLAVSLAALLLVDLSMLVAETPEAFGRAVWLFHFPLWACTLGTVLYFRLYLGVGRVWLGALAVAVRSVATAINAFSIPNLNYRGIHAVDRVDLWGVEASVARGDPGPWMWLGTLGFALLAAFVIDSAVTLWRRGDRKRAAFVGGMVALITIWSGLAIVLYVHGSLRMPAFMAFLFVPIAVALAVESGEGVTGAAMITTRLQTNERELREFEMRLGLAAEAAGVGLWGIIGTSGRMWSTQAADGMVGLAPGERFGFAEVLERVHPDDRGRLLEALETARSTGSAAVEYRVIRPGGEVRWLLSVGRAGLFAPDPPGSVTGVTLDITELRRVESQAARQRLELDRLATAANLSEFSGAMAHELSQPLAIILSNAEAARNLLHAPDPRTGLFLDILDDIVQAAERASRVLSGLEKLFDRHTPTREAIRINRLIATACDSLQLQLSGFDVQYRLADDLPDAAGDSHLIGQVIVNLVANACQAMDSNEPELRRLVIETTATSESIMVRVEDCGVGLPQDADRVFEPFFTTKSDGIGIGLSICRAIIESHGGRIGAESSPRGGSILWFSLPLQAGVDLKKSDGDSS